MLRSTRRCLSASPREGSRAVVLRCRTTMSPVPDPDLAPVVATARDRYAEVLASGALPSVRALRKELRIGHPRAVRVRAALEAESVTESTLA